MNNVKSVKEIKKLIDEVKLPDYTYKTNFSSAEFLVDFDCGLIVAAKLIKQDDKMIFINVGSISLPKNDVATYAIYENKQFIIYDIIGNIVDSINL